MPSTRPREMSLLLVLIACGAQGAPCVVTLTDVKPKGACALSAAILARPPLLVEVPVTKIENPSGQSFSVQVSLAAGEATPELVGNVTVFPSNQTGTFVMRCGPAFEHLSVNRKHARLIIEIRRVSETRPWQSISVSVGPLRWLYEEPK